MLIYILLVTRRIGSQELWQFSISFHSYLQDFLVLFSLLASCCVALRTYLLTHQFTCLCQRELVTYDTVKQLRRTGTHPHLCGKPGRLARLPQWEHLETSFNDSLSRGLSMSRSKRKVSYSILAVYWQDQPGVFPVHRQLVETSWNLFQAVAKEAEPHFQCNSHFNVANE